MRSHTPSIALVLVAAAAASAAPRPLAAQVVVGIVIEHTTGDPMPDVAVQLLEPEGRAVATTLSDGDGRFRLAAPRAGVWRIAAERVGYGRAEADSLDVPERGTLNVEIRMAVQPVALDSAIIVTAESSFANAEIEGFHQRRVQGSGFGHFIYGEAIRRGSGGRPTDLLRSVPGVRINSNRYGTGSIIHMRAGCVPALFVDGMEINRFSSAESLDHYLSVQDIEGIEVYRGIPPGVRFFDRRGCGVVLVWTRRGEASGSGGSLLARLLVALGLVAVIMAFR